MNNIILQTWDRTISAISTVVYSRKEASKSNLTLISRGAGLSYGDASINRRGIVLLSDNIKKINFNSRTGVVTVSTNVTVYEVLKELSRHDRSLAVLPGSSQVTIGGCIASNVHGKNHHVSGSFSEIVLSMLIQTDLKSPPKQYSKTRNRELFKATFGGMGLTGIIIEAQLKTIPLINSARLRVIKFENLEELFRKIESYRYTQEYIIGLVNWQSLRPGSGKIFTIEFHQKSSKKFKLSPSSNILPLTFPFINKFTIFIYNLFYFANYKFEKNINPFKIIFLADKFRNVNRWFGRKGFIEYQFSIPKNEIKVAIWIMQDFKQNFTIYLSGVKLLSDMSIGLMNFVQEGYTITLTTTPSKKLFSYLHKYDRVLGKVGGKVYLAKDSRMASHNFNKMYPDLQKFRDIRIKYRLQKFSSDLSVRLKF